MYCVDKIRKNSNLCTYDTDCSYAEMPVPHRPHYSCSQQTLDLFSAVSALAIQLINALAGGGVEEELEHIIVFSKFGVTCSSSVLER